MPPAGLLLTSAGTQCYLVEAFASALDGEDRLVVADSSPDAPTLHLGRPAVVLPRAREDHYIPSLLATSVGHSVGWVMSLNEDELIVLDAAADQLALEGIQILGPTGNALKACIDKPTGSAVLRQAGLRVPCTLLGREAIESALDAGQVTFPAVGKLRQSRASVGQVLLRDRDEALWWLQAPSIPDASALMIQPWLEGQEYGMDVVNGLNRVPAGVLIRRKRLMRNGETSVAVTVHDEELQEVGLRIGRALGHRGMVDCDVIVTREGPVVIDLNPRFGGGYPFNHFAGADVPRAMLAWLRGSSEGTGFLQYRSGVTAARVSQLQGLTALDLIQPGSAP